MKGKFISKNVINLLQRQLTKSMFGQIRLLDDVWIDKSIQID